MSTYVGTRKNNARLRKAFGILLCISVLIYVCAVSGLFGANTAHAAFNQQINYQGKLTSNGNVAVADGTYNMRFWLAQSLVQATTSAIWTESLTGANRVQVTNGLFSIMLGSTSPLANVNFNQTLYLGVEIGGTSATPVWDGEMSPRKIIGAVPAAFEAFNLGGASTTQYVRTDQPSTIASTSASTLLTINQSGAGAILNLLSAGTNVFTALSNGNVGIGTTTPQAKLSIEGGPMWVGPWAGGALNSSAGKGLKIEYTTGLDVGALLAYDYTNSVPRPLAIQNTSGARTGIGTAQPNGTLTVKTNLTSASSTFDVVNGASSTLFSILANGNIGVGTSTPVSQFHVDGSSPALSISDNNQAQVNGLFQFVDSGRVLTLYQGLFGSTASARLAASSTQVTVNGLGVQTVSSGLFTGTNLIYFPTSGNSYINNGSNFGVGSTSPWAQLSASSTSATPALAIQQNGAGAAAIFLGGSVGIGTTTPLSLFHVSGGNITIDNQFALNGRDTTGATRNLISVTSANNVQVGDTNYNAGLQFFSKGVTQFFTNGTQQMVITNTGNVGIGTTTPWGQLAASSTSANPALAIQQNGAGAAAIFQGGNVGIGTTSPSSLLTVAGAGTFAGNLQAANITATGTLTALGNTILQNASSTAESTGSFAAGQTGTTTINTAGNLFSPKIGIGTTTPSSLLTISASAGPLTTLFNIATTTGASTTNLFSVNSAGQVNLNNNSALTFGSLYGAGSQGYGIRENGGMIEFRNAYASTTAYSNSWTPISAAANVKYQLNEGGWVDTGATLPAATSYGQTVVIGDYVYLFGGCTNTGCSTSTNVIYRAPVSNPTAWVNTGAVLPAALDSAQALVIGDYVYLFGGSTNGASVNVIYRAPVSNPTAWVDTGATLPGTLSDSQAVVLGDYVYLFGGWNGGAVNVIYRAPVSNPTAWVNTGATLPGGVGMSQALVIGDYVYLFGGYTGAASAIIYRTPVSNPTAWVNTGATLPNAGLSSAQVAMVGDYVYLLAGFDGGGASNVIYRAPAANPLAWSTATGVLPTGLEYSSAFILGDYMYLLGGNNGSAVISNIYRAPLTSTQNQGKSWLARSNALTGNGWFTTGTSSANLSFFGANASLAGKIGIGTTSPLAKLDVWQTTGGSNALFSIASSTNGLATSTAFLVAGNGFVGIGTSSPTSLLTVAGAGTFAGNLQAANITATGTLAVTGATTLANASTTNLSANLFSAGQTGTTSINGAGVLTSRQILIGTTSSPWNLQIASTTPYLAISDTDAGTNLKHWIFSNNGGLFTIGTSSDALTSTSSLFTISGINGYHGVGTSTPWGKLSVDASNLLNSPAFVVGSSTATSFIVGSTGNVGIGTSSPFAKLSVVTNATANETNPLFWLATTSSIANLQQPILWGFATTTGDLDYARVAVGTTTVWGKSGIRDQLTVAGRIYSTWLSLNCVAGSSLGTTTNNNNLRMGGACGDFALDVNNDGDMEPQATYPPRVRLRAGITTSFAANEAAYLRSTTLLAPATSSPVMETRVGIPASSQNGGNGRNYIVGWADTVFGTTTGFTTLPGNGVFFAASTTNNWSAYVMRAGTPTAIVDTGISTTSGQVNLNRMRIEVSSSSAIFLIDGAVVANVRPTLGMPTGPMAPMVGIYATTTFNGGAGVSDIDISYIQAWVDDPATVGGDTIAASSAARTPQDTSLNLVQNGDIAEYYQVSSTSDYIPGMLVTSRGTNRGYAARTDHAYDDTLFGAISTNAQTMLGQSDSGLVNVSLAGRAPVIVSLENGAIAQGDAITSSKIPGMGMRAGMPGQVIGHALESVSQSSCNAALKAEVEKTGVTLPQNACLVRILVAIEPGFSIGGSDVFAEAATSTASFTTLALELASSAFDRGATFTKFVTGEIAAKVAYVGQIFSSEVHTKTLCVADANGAETCISKDQLDALISSAGKPVAPSAVGGTGGAAASGTTGNTAGGATSGTTGSTTGNSTGTTTSGGVTGSTTADTEAPTIAVIGGTTVNVTVGAAYTDLGATVSDNVDTNLSYTMALDGGAAVTPAAFTLDTSLAGTHSIVYSATDKAGNVGTVTRTVVVVAAPAPVPPPTPPTASSTPPTP